MDLDLDLPDEAAVMTLPGTTFFPEALLPLHIFEPRYQAMLRDVLASHGLFAVAGLNPAGPGNFEPPHRVATLGLVRACQKNDDGTSNLVLQGLARVEVLGIVREQPYRFARLRVLASDPGLDPDRNVRLRASLARLLVLKHQLEGTPPADLSHFLKQVDDPAKFADLAASNHCRDARLQQRLLETLEVTTRLRLLGEHLRRQIASLKLRHKLQGGLPDTKIGLN